MWKSASVVRRSALFMVIVLYSCLPWVAESAPTPPVICPTGWFGFEETQTCYKLYHNRKVRIWNARDICLRQGGDGLVTFNDPHTVDFIAGRLASPKLYLTDIYKDIGQPAHYTSKSNEEVDMGLFGPRIKGGKTAGYGIVSVEDGQLWLSYAASTVSSSFICERRPPKHRSVCPNKWTMYTDQDGHTSCVKVHDTDQRSWDGARTQCQHEGGHLITLENSGKNTFVKDLLMGPSTYWIQKTNLPNKIPFFQWHEKSYNYEKKCLNLKDFSVGHHLNKARCQTTHPFICEKDSVTLSTASCSPGWELYNSETCIKVVIEKRTWQESSDKCQELNGTLAVIPDEPTSDFINGIIDNYFWFWSGGPNNNSRGEMTCTVTSTNWVSGLVSSSVGCENLFRFVCQGGIKPVKDTPQSYWDAKLSCEDEGGLDFGGTPSDLPRYDIFFFIGLSLNGQNFEWVDGTSLGSFHPWGHNQPNGQQCVCVAPENNMTWHDLHCYYKNHCICQKSAVIETYQYCPEGWMESPNRLKCFKFYRDDPKNVADAEKTCQVTDGNLFTIGDREKNKFIIEHISSGPNTAWIGARYDKGLTTFVWDSNGQRLTYNGWKNSTTRPGPDTDCGSIARYPEDNNGYVWDNVSCNKTLPYICQTDDAFPATVFTCPQGYTTFREGFSCFQVYHNEPMLDWNTARQVCQHDGGDLALVYDKATNAFVADLLSQEHVYWIGLIQYGNDSEWNWLDGSIQDISDDGWFQDEPNYSHEHCAVLFHPSVYGVSTTKLFYWADLQCELIKSFVCQHKGHTGLTDLKAVTTDGRTYYISYHTLPFSDVEHACQFYNMEHLFIESHDHFMQLQAWVSNTSFLQEDGIWIQTNKPLFWDFNTWSNNDFVNPDAWVSDIQDRVCSNEQECCVSMARDTQRPGHYLTNTQCSDKALYICVEENNVTKTDIPQPKLVADNKRSMTILRETVAANNKTLNNKCPCRCGTIFIPNPSPEILEELKAQIVKKLIVKTSDLSATVHKKTSAPDRRASSQSIGYLAVLIVFIAVFLIIGVDCIRLYQWIKK